MNWLNSDVANVRTNDAFVVCMVVLADFVGISRYRI
jgi:hypothetical protein